VVRCDPPKISCDFLNKIVNSNFFHYLLVNRSNDILGQGFLGQETVQDTARLIFGAL